ncbi:MAG: phosphoadenosine phosphosulfate reductase family protein, partial [Acidobacteria bacterium]|nr:phosphoadenosine phosphosulfate reductase family protein [Acidobacteriota bacterium]
MQLRLFEPEAPPLKNFRWIVVNSSGGKDSQTALRQVVQICDQQQVSRERIHVSHQDLGEAEWPGTMDLVKRQAACYGLPVTVTRYRTQKGEELTLLDNVQKRGKWPSSQQRYCTSDFKRGPGSRVITQLGAGSVLNVYGFRAEESPARAKKH